MVSRILASLARRESGRFLGRTMDRYLPMEPVSLTRPSTLVGGIVAAVALRVATGSVPGALVVGGGILAKALIDRGRKERLAREAQAAAGEQATGMDHIG